MDPEIDALTPGQRREDLAFLQALLEQSYPHLEEKVRRFRLNVSALIEAHRPALMSARNRYQYMGAVDRALLAFHDGHLTTRGYGRTFRRTYRPRQSRASGRRRGRRRPRPVLVDVGLTLRYLAGQVVVLRVRQGSTAEAAGIQPGDVVLLAGHIPALSRMGSTLRWRSWSRLEAGLALAASRVLIARPWYPDTPMPSVTLLLRRGARRLSVTLTGGRTPPREERLLSLRQLRCSPAALQQTGGPQHRLGGPGAPSPLPEASRRSTPRVGLLRVATFAPASARLRSRLSSLLSKAGQLDGLVLDLRGNRGGSQGMARRLVARLIQRPVLAGEYRYLRTRVLARRVPVIDKLPADPDDSRWTTWQKDIIRPASSPLRLPTVVLVDELCASACETAARALRAAPGITLFGRPTAGSSGLPVLVPLPRSRLLVSLPSWQSRTADHSPVEGHGVKPHVQVYLSLAALRAGGDPVLDAARESLCRRVRRLRTSGRTSPRL